MEKKGVKQKNQYKDTGVVQMVTAQERKAVLGDMQRDVGGLAVKCIKCCYTSCTRC